VWLTEAPAGGTPVGNGDMAGDPCRVFDAADMFFEKNSKRHVRQESSCLSYNLNCLGLYFV
jgi:hypothetical protein